MTLFPDSTQKLLPFIIIAGYNSKYFPLTATNKSLLLAVSHIFYTFAANNNLIK